MTAACGLIGFERQIRILHARFHFAVEGGAEQISESEVGAADAPFVVKGGFVSGDDASAALHVGAKLIALRVGEGGNVGKQEDFVAINVLSIEQAVVNHLKRNA